MARETAGTNGGKVWPDDAMTSRERLLAAYTGREVDRVPYWAKVCNPTWRTTQPEAVRTLRDRALLDFIHADGIFGVPGFVRVETPHVESRNAECGIPAKENGRNGRNSQNGEDSHDSHSGVEAAAVHEKRQGGDSDCRTPGPGCAGQEERQDAKDGVGAATVKEALARAGGGDRVIVHRTPDGVLTERWGFDPLTRSYHPVEFPVKTAADLKAFRWLYTDRRLTVDEAALAKARARVAALGERGITQLGWGTTPLMHLVEHVLGPVQTAYMLADAPAAMDELIGLMHEANLALVRSVAEATPSDLVVSVENTSTTLISPTQFRRFCLPHLIDVGRAVEAAGRMHELHMCGKTKALLADIDMIPAASIEAFTAPSLGDTRLVDGRTLAPSKTLVGGTRVNTWLAPLEGITGYIAGELAACPDRRRIVLTTAGVAPPACRAETFRAVGEWMKAHAPRGVCLTAGPSP